MENYSFVDAEKALTSFRNYKEVLTTNSKTLLDNPETKLIIQSFKDNREKEFYASINAIESFKRYGGNRYNLFRKIGFYADENYLSDAIASMLSPRHCHGLGTSVLKCLLDYLERQWVGTRYQDRITNISFSLKQEVRYSVIREKIEYQTRPDIAVIGSNFIIYIENKVRGGKETDKLGKWQTTRQSEALKNTAKRLDIPEGNALGIYLSPEGKPAFDMEFIPMPVQEFIMVVKEAVKCSSDIALVQSIFAFLDFYSVAPGRAVKWSKNWFSCH